MVMVSNHSGIKAGYLAGRYPGMLGHLYSPGAQRGPWPFLPYGLDNGAYPLWHKNLDWKEAPWRKLMDWAASKPVRPTWAVVPDVVTNREATLARWEEFAPVVRGYGFRAAFAVQDGMDFADVPDSDCVLFLGGSTAWKKAAIGPWCRKFPGRVHVARVNDSERLYACLEAGAVSVDGNGWFHEKGTARDGRSQYTELVEYLERLQRRLAA